MAGLTLIGPIANTSKVPAPTELEQLAESEGVFVAGDARDIALWSGNDLGSRWLCRAQGPAVELLRDWPTPGNETWRYHASRDAAVQMYETLKAHLSTRFPGVQAYDGRDVVPLNVPEGMAERFFQNGTNEVMRLFVDRMTDLQIAVRNTEGIRRFNADPAREEGPFLVTYYTASDVCYLAIATGASGAAEHVAIVYSPRHEPEPAISQGMPRAESRKKSSFFRLDSGFLVAGWARASGRELLAPAGGGDPAPAFHHYLGARVAAPLSTNVPGLDARMAAPGAWVVRVEPGEWQALYYELDAHVGEGYSFLCLSRKDAAPFQPYVPGNAGGRTIGGLTLEQYAMLTAERERTLMTQGPNAEAALVELCRRWNQPIPGGPGGVLGYAARIVDWDLAIQGDAKLSAEFVAQKTIAGYRMQGIEPTPEMLAQIRSQADFTQQQLAQAASNNKATADELFEGSKKLIEAARNLQPPQLVEEAKKLFPRTSANDGTPAYGFYKAIAMLKRPNEDGNPKFFNVEQVTEKLAKAHWLCMKEEDRKFEGNNEKKYVKEVIADVYEPNGLQVPGVGGFFSKLIDKL